MKLISREQLIKIIPNRISLPVGRKMLVMKQQSPHIFFAAGVAGMIVSTVLACRATLKLSQTLDEIETDVDIAKKKNHALDQLKLEPLEVEATKDFRQDLTYVYIRGGLKIGRLYGPSVVIGMASITLLTGSHIQMTRRNAALMAAFTSLQTAFEEYRDRVREEIGEEKESDLYQNFITKTVVGDDGKETEVKMLRDPTKYSLYAKFFDEGSRHWKKDPEYNRMYIQCQQQYANDLLWSRGHVFLNEVYDMLGIDRTNAGQMVGWLLNSEGGDNYVSFHIFEIENSRFVNGWERSILLDFNVDGNIQDKI